MSLQEYKKKRRFSATPEPHGEKKAGKGALRFVVQKHMARREHYDFRLEMDGVMKSWAVPKGPSLNPNDKRLAVMVEDHPLEYRTFEGIIPAGNYGAGTVMVWDEGTVEPREPGTRAENEKKLLAGIEEGHLRFVLHGHKLNGAFSLVKTKRGKNEWLLFKRADDFSSDKDVLEENLSAATGRSMAEIAAEASGRGAVWQSNAPKRHARLPITITPPKSPEAKMPHHVKPMLAQLVDTPFDNPNWVFEVKWDGYRAIAEVEKGKVRLYSRRQLAFDKYEPIVKSLAQLGHDAVLDGEVVVLDPEGRAQFELLQKYQKTRQGWLIYYVFDLLWLDGHDLRDLPLRERKELLPALVRGFTNIKVSEHVPEKGIAFYEAAERMGLEGIIAKKADSAYREGLRSQSWLKLKVRKQQEAVIAGFTPPRGSREKMGSLVLGVYDDGELRYIGRAGGGFNEKSLADVFERLTPLVQEECPFKKKPKMDKPATWVKPKLVCEIVFQNWTSDGHVRMPIFVGLREDKEPRSVKRETPLPLPRSAENNRNGDPPDDGVADSARPRPWTRSAGGAVNFPEGKFTNLDKIYWPEDGYTKGDLLAYYHDVAPFILPYLHDRPMSLNRHPDGIHGENFFQKRAGRQKLPDWIQEVDAPSERHGHIRFLMCQDEKTLLYIANLGCIELNPWNSRTPTFDRPDYLVIDLDPQEVPFPEVVRAAQTVRKVFESGGVACYCKTSGKRGLHVYVPLAAQYDYDQARQFGEIVAHIVKAQLPATTSMDRNPARRRTQIYLDYLQNRRGQTMAAAYSLRPVEGAQVSTPLDWKEVGPKLDPKAFNLKTIRKRLDKVGDLWAPVLGSGIDMQKCLNTLLPGSTR